MVPVLTIQLLSNILWMIQSFLCVLHLVDNSTKNLNRVGTLCSNSQSRGFYILQCNCIKILQSRSILIKIYWKGRSNTWYITIFNCSHREAIIVNVCLRKIFLWPSWLFDWLLHPWLFCVSRDLKFSLNHNFKQLNSIGGNLILNVKWKVRRNWCHFSI